MHQCERKAKDITRGGRSALVGTVTPGGITLDAMAVLEVALHDVVYDFGCILNSTCAIPERTQASNQIGRSCRSLHWLACDTAGDQTHAAAGVGGGNA